MDVLQWIFEKPMSVDTEKLLDDEDQEVVDELKAVDWPDEQFNEHYINFPTDVLEGRIEKRNNQIKYCEEELLRYQREKAIIQRILEERKNASTI